MLSAEMLKLAWCPGKAGSHIPEHGGKMWAQKRHRFFAERKYCWKSGSASRSLPKKDRNWGAIRKSCYTQPCCLSQCILVDKIWEQLRSPLLRDVGRYRAWGRDSPQVALLIYRPGPCSPWSSHRWRVISTSRGHPSNQLPLLGVEKDYSDLFPLPTAMGWGQPNFDGQSQVNDSWTISGLSPDTDGMEHSQTRLWTNTCHLEFFCEFVIKLRTFKSLGGVEHLQAQEMSQDITKCDLNFLHLASEPWLMGQAAEV